MKLGSVGDTGTLAWLFCDLQGFGKTLVRKGAKADLPIDRPPIWVFCPLLRKNFPRDRTLVETKVRAHTLKSGKGTGTSPNVRVSGRVTA